MRNFEADINEMNPNQLQNAFDHLAMILLDPNYFNQAREINRKKDAIHNLLTEKFEIDIV